ncbi:MAG: sialate O-acetylesterase, partial [Pseudomonadota bacterium]
PHMNPRITITEPGVYDHTDSPTEDVEFASYCTIEATAPVTIGFEAEQPSDAEAILQLRTNGLWFKGENITIDHRHMLQIQVRDNARPHVFEGCTITNSAGREHYWRKGIRPIVPVFWSSEFPDSASAWYLDCEVTEIANGAVNANMVRGVLFNNTFGDTCTASLGVIGCKSSRHNGAFYASDVPAMTIQGPTGATLDLEGGNDASARTLTAREGGATIGVFTIERSNAAYLAGANYSVSNVVDWINDLSGWSATLLDDTRRATALSVLGNKGAAFSDLDVSSPQTLVTMFDIHGDFYQQLFGNTKASENLLVYGNEATDWTSQWAILNSDDPLAKDVSILNNAAHFNPTETIPYAINSAFFTQFAGGAQSHVVFAHNTFANQGVLLRADQSFAPDGYSLFANNSVRSMRWEGIPSGSATIADNHVHDLSGEPQGGLRSASGGNEHSLYVDAESGNFTAAGDLASNPKAPVFGTDTGGDPRSEPAPAGASSQIGDAQAQPLDFIAYGQSNTLFWVTRSDSGTPAPHPDTQVWDIDTQAWISPSGEGAIQFLNAMRSATGRPCRLVFGGVSGVPIDRLQKGHPDGNYEALIADIQASGIDPAFIIWHQGEGDAAGTAPTAGDYQADLDTLHGDLATDTGRTRAELPIVLSSLATTTSPSVATDAAWQTIQNDLASITDSYPNIHFSHSNMTAVRLDTFHWNAESYGESGALSAQTVLVLLGRQSTRPNWTLDLIAERISPTQTRVNVTHALGNDFTPISSITGFEVSGDAGNNWITATGVRENPTSIILDHADLGTSTRLIRYQYGRNPDISGAVRDNSALAVPLQFTVGSLVAIGAAAAPVLTHHNSFEVGGGTIHSGSIPLLGVTEESLCVISGQHRGNVDLLSLEVTAQPSGTVLSPILVDEDTSGSRPTAYLYRSVVPANTTSIDLVATYSSNTFSRGIYHAWTSVASGLNSLVPVDQASVREASSASVTGSPQTSAGGFVIAVATTRETRGLGTLTGDEIYNVRDQQEKSNFSWVVGDAQDVLANADSDVDATFNAPGEMAIVAGSWR